MYYFDEENVARISLNTKKETQATIIRAIIENEGQKSYNKHVECRKKVEEENMILCQENDIFCEKCQKTNQLNAITRITSEYQTKTKESITWLNEKLF